MTVAPATMAVLIGLGALTFLIAVAVAPIPDARGRHWILLFSVVVFPGLALLVGATSAFEAAKRPEFCGSCHEMGPWVRDLHDDGSTTLAAIHYQNRYIRDDQCYTCHTDYGLTGPLRAKLTGMVHLFKHETGTWQYPLALYRPYDFGNCLQCHGEAKRYREAHEDALEAIADGSMACTDCHDPLHPAQEGE